jgi:signal transduction histidine kinase/uncharacterized protein YigA (DUF484 family)
MLAVELLATLSRAEKAGRGSSETAIQGLLRPSSHAPDGSTQEEGEQNRSVRQQQHAQSRLHAVLQLSQRVASSADLDTLLHHLVKALHQDLGYPYVDVVLVSDSRANAVLRVASGPPAALAPGPGAGSTAGFLLDIDERDIVGMVVNSGETILLNDSSGADVDLLFQDPADIASALAVPVTTSSGVAGVLIARSNQADVFTLDDVILLQIAADHVAIALENSLLLGERDQHLAELAALNQIGMLLASPSELVGTLDALIRQVSALFQVEAASLILVEDGKLHFKVAAGTHIDEIKPYTLAIGQGIAGWAVQHNQTLRVNNVGADPRHYEGIDDSINFDTRSLIAAPMRIASRPQQASPGRGEERVIGVIEIINRLDGKPFTRNDEVLIEFIASSAAVVVENVRLFQELQDRLAEMAALLDTSRAITTLELQEVLDTTVQRVSTALDAEHCIAYLLDDEGRHLRAQATNRQPLAEPLEALVFAVGQGTVGKIAQTRQALHVADAQNSPDFLKLTAFSSQVYCTLGVPLIVQNELIGVLEVLNKQSQPRFTSSDEQLLSAFGGQVALAIHNAGLYRQSQRRIENLAALGRASEAINRALGRDEILKAAVEAAAAIVPDRRGVALLLREEQTGGLQAAIHEGFDISMVSALERLRIEEVHNQGIREISDSLRAIPLLAQSPGSTPLFAVPLRGREEVTGLIVLGVSTPPNEAARLLQTLGDMVAIAIEKARLHEETSRRLAEVSTLYTLANQITTVLDLDRILETTVTIIHHALDCQGCCLHLYDPQTGRLTLKASSGWRRGEQETADLEIINQVSRQVLRERRPINLTNLNAPVSPRRPRPDLRAAAWAPVESIGIGPGMNVSIRSLLVVPLITKNNLIGTLSIDDRTPDAFGPGEGRLLTIAAAQVSVAIENARLLRHLADRAMQLEQALDELRELHRLKTEFVQNVSHELRTPLTFIKNYVQLVLDDAMGNINADVRRALNIVNQKTNAVIRLVNDVISLEQMELGKFEFQPVNLREVAAQSVEGAAMTAKNAEVSIQLITADGLPLLHADPGRLGQVFDNLLSNAIKFSRADTTITVRLWQDGAYVRADIEDQGIGIPADKLDQIFDRFYQVDGSTTRRYGGTGLGLAIVKSIVESHGGQVIVESEVGVGSTFSVILPIPRDLGGEG